MHPLHADKDLKEAESQLFASKLAKEFGDPLLDIEAFAWQKLSFNSDIKKLIQQHSALPLQQRGNKLFLALSNPTNQKAIEAFQFYFGLSIQVILVEENKLLKILEKLLLGSKPTHASDSIVELLDEILEHAIEKKASDIHIEPYQNHCRIRFRKDGLLFEYVSKDSTVGIKLITRLKILSQCDIAERRLPQDGHFKFSRIGKNNMDMRISVIPSFHGEKAVIRLLDPSQMQMGIESLGMEEKQISSFVKSISSPQGIILVTGPTGSGKTVTLYSALHALNQPHVNILTIEDPIEIQIPGITQVNIHPKIGLTFSHALRSFLRQDPDIMMVGEIRDKETAEIAIQAAQTGHLVLSTLHTNNATEAVSRLESIGIPAYNLSSINLIIAQRLVRKLCCYCKEETKYSPAFLRDIEFNYEDVPLYSSRGCEHCHLGYNGRIGIFEMLNIKEEKEPSLQLRAAGFMKVAAGITSLEEVLRVV